MIERSQLLVFSGFDEKKGWNTLHGNFIGTKGVGLQTMNLGFFPAERNRGREKGENRRKEKEGGMGDTHLETCLSNHFSSK